jgi:GntR family transcriptional regulator, transcriptional repressor for pyruvate dehydrogenase complex
MAAAILLGDFKANEPLPPERILAERFDVSRLVLRQALHQLAEVNLVRVRQGGPTIVLEPAQVGDIRLIGIYYMLDPGGAAAEAIRKDAVEKQVLQGFAIVDVCARRATAADREHLRALATDFDADAATQESFAHFEETFWRAAANAGKNRIYQMETVWWYETLAQARPQVESSATFSERVAFYRELARLLAAGTGATAYYHAVMWPQLEALFGADPRS